MRGWAPQLCWQLCRQPDGVSSRRSHYPQGPEDLQEMHPPSCHARGGKHTWPPGCFGAGVGMGLDSRTGVFSRITGREKQAWHLPPLDPALPLTPPRSLSLDVPASLMWGRKVLGNDPAGRGRRSSHPVALSCSFPSLGLAWKSPLTSGCAHICTQTDARSGHGPLSATNGHLLSSAPRYSVKGQMLVTDF